MAAISKPKNLAEALEAKTKTMASAKKELAKVIDSEKEDDEENDDAYWFSSIESEKEDEYGDYGDEDYYDEYGNEAFQKKKKKKFKVDKAYNRISMFAWWTHYDVIKEVGKFVFEYHLTRREVADWDLAWSDGPNTIKFLQKMQPY
jgi:hypothetical protein